MVAISVLFVALSCLYIVLSASGSAPSTAAHPGKVALWSLGHHTDSTSTTTQYNTVSATFDSAVHLIKGALSKKAELTLALRSSSHQSVDLTDDALASFARKVSASTVMPYIYKSEGSKGGDLHHHISQSEFMKGAKKLSLEEVHSAVSESIANEKGFMFDGHADAIEATLSGDAAADAQRLSSLAALAAKSGKTISVIACQEPGDNAFELKTEGQYSRVLGAATDSAGSSSDKTDGIYYKPSGAEYSIYYANTYLYMTPDILTGILTGLFMAFVVYLGLSSMNKIQGGSNFPIRKIDNGKEM